MRIDAQWQLWANQVPTIWASTSTWVLMGARVPAFCRVLGWYTTCLCSFSAYTAQKSKFSKLGFMIL